MIPKRIGNYEIPGLTLGTVSLGLNYGVFNGQEQPDEGIALSLLHTALENGITCFDTAREYGTAETLLGDLLSEVFPRQAAVVTKFKITKEALGDLSLAKEQARNSVLESRAQLNLPMLPFCLFHMVSDYDRDLVAEMIPQLLASLKQENLIGFGGISVDNLPELQWLAFLPEVQVLQIPINIFDQRLPGDDPFWCRLEKERKLVFARSVFLKGLLLKHPATLTGNLRPAAFYLDQLAIYAKRCGLSVAQFCFSYVRDFRTVTSIVAGADNKQQLLENIALLNAPRIPDEILDEAKIFFKNVPEHILIPRTWKL
ncbi:aldo/keto reductase [Niabella beijingensis]|uniref:aldo/keto reductase n=1 Tax=Niabella beijingensis TaxID=2872700 RepID=UPI001CBA9FCC|nr:aldo/keto reductase [Niabella beijingensis]MBZ4191399.1 aldo/keto reductase [Niabella beijingensis]